MFETTWMELNQSIKIEYRNEAKFSVRLDWFSKCFVNILFALIIWLICFFHVDRYSTFMGVINTKPNSPN